MRLQAEVSGDQGHNVRTDIEPVRMDIRKKSIVVVRASLLGGFSNNRQSLPEVNQALVWTHQGIRWSKAVISGLL